MLPLEYYEVWKLIFELCTDNVSPVCTCEIVSYVCVVYACMYTWVCLSLHAFVLASGKHGTVHLLLSTFIFEMGFLTPLPHPAPPVDRWIDR